MSSSKPRQSAITDALLQIVAERGFEEVSVREVAAGAGVSIGTVQHYFPTKDEMLVAAYHEVVSRVRARLTRLPVGEDNRKYLSSVLSEILPVDERRRIEARIHVAFAARAANAPRLADIQRTVLGDIHFAVSCAFARALGRRSPDRYCGLLAHAAIATVDGLALHAISSGGWPPARRQVATMELTLDALLAAAAPAVPG
jgi:AcrR family transcriptional regulator